MHLYSVFFWCQPAFGVVIGSFWEFSASWRYRLWNFIHLRPTGMSLFRARVRGVVPFVALFGRKRSGEGESQMPINATGGAGELVTSVPRPDRGGDRGSVRDSDSGQGKGRGWGSWFFHLRPSGPPPASQRRTGSVVVRVGIGRLGPRCPRERRPPSELERDVTSAEPVECPARTLCGTGHGSGRSYLHNAEPGTSR